MAEGIAEQDFWRQTPAETQRRLSAIRLRRNEAYERAAWHGWHTAAYVLEGLFTGKLPELEPILARVGGRPEREQSDDELLEAGRRLVRAFAHLPEGGE